MIKKKGEQSCRSCLLECTCIINSCARKFLTVLFFYTWKSLVFFQYLYLHTSAREAFSDIIHAENKTASHNLQHTGSEFCTLCFRLQMGSITAVILLFVLCVVFTNHVTVSHCRKGHVSGFAMAMKVKAEVSEVKHCSEDKVNACDWLTSHSAYHCFITNMEQGTRKSGQSHALISHLSRITLRSHFRFEPGTLCPVNLVHHFINKVLSMSAY
jgi:hypothetical protein